MLIEDLVDRAELAELVARHSIWIDQPTFDDSQAIFTDDVVATSARGEAHGIDELIGLAKRNHGRFSRTLHTKANLVISVDGDDATIWAHDIAVYVIDDSSEAIAAAVHVYSARRTDNGWRFTRLEIEPVALSGELARAM